MPCGDLRLADRQRCFNRRKGAAVTGQIRDLMLEDFAGMLRIRGFEEKVRALRVAGEIVGSVHLCIGQEAGPVGACAALFEQDAVFATYRGHGWAIARGVPVEPLFAELLGRESGLCGGRGGSAYKRIEQGRGLPAALLALWATGTVA